MFSLSHPEHYLPILIFLLVAIGFGGITLSVGKLIRPRNPYKDKNAPYECGVPPINDARERFSIRYYVIAMLFLVFDVEVVFLYPWAVNFDPFPIQVQQDAQHPMCAGMLGAHVQKKLVGLDRGIQILENRLSQVAQDNFFSLDIFGDTCPIFRFQNRLLPDRNKIRQYEIRT